MNRKLILIALIFWSAAFLSAQSEDAGEELFSRRIIWRGGENALRYQVEIEKQEGGVYAHALREFTTSLFIDVNLPEGDYRFRIIPHDVLDRPGEGTRWYNFTVLAPAVTVQPDDLPEDSDPAEEEQRITIDISGIEEEPEPELAEEPEHEREPAAEDAPVRDNSFNTVGFSLGTSFTDPLFIAGIHGTYTLTGNLFAELGIDVGFISVHEDVESFFSFFPYANLGLFFPFGSRSGFFVGAGAGCMFNNYSLSSGDASFNVFAANLSAGINLGGFFNVSYSIRTNFSSANHKLAVGVVYQ